jgi:DNA-binding CsgD family transcriptional regulator
MKVTPAERDALRAVWENGSTKRAAHALGKSVRTVEQQLATAKARLGVDDNYNAIRLVVVEGDT